jgi:hypothetical protein
MGYLGVPWRNWQLFFVPETRSKSEPLLMFELSPAGRRNLEVILLEFERARSRYGDLCHERFANEPDFGNEAASVDEWNEFIRNATEQLPKGEWSEWEFLQIPGLNDWGIGRWFGDPAGRQKFCSLVDGLLAVLNREDVTAIPHKVIPFDFSSLDGWVGTLHSWAYRIQMPLLSCHSLLWGFEYFDRDAAPKFAMGWITSKEGTRYPANPYRFELDFDVFTSSMTAIRALLEPEYVIGQNEPWPLRKSLQQSLIKLEGMIAAEDEAEHAKSPRELSKAKHVISHGLYGWEIWFRGADKQVRPANQAGLHRLAKLIETAPEGWCPKQLSEYGARKFGAVGKAASETLSRGEAHDLIIGAGRGRNRDDVPAEVADERKKTLEKLKQLRIDRAEAERDGDRIQLEEINEEIRRLAEFVNDNERDPVFKKAKDGIRTTINRLIKELMEIAPERKTDIEQLEIRVDTKSTQISFRGDPEAMDWIVHRGLF